MKHIQCMVSFNHAEIRYTPNCLVIKEKKVNVIRLGYKYSKINKDFFYK